MAAYRRRTPVHSVDSKLYDDYYLDQVGNGLPVFTGARVQRGHGLGNVFSGLIRAAMPLMKSGMKLLGKHGVKTGMQIAGDVLSGQNPKRAVRQRAKQAGTEIVHDALRQFMPGPPGQPSRSRQQTATKRRAQSQTVSSTRAAKRSRAAADIFT